MPFPDGWNTVTITGSYRDLDGMPAAGDVMFVAQGVQVIDGASVVPRELSALLDETGAISIDLPVGDEAITYAVTERVNNGRPRFLTAISPGMPPTNVHALVAL